MSCFVTCEHGSEICVFISFVRCYWQHADKGPTPPAFKVAITVGWRMVAQRGRDTEEEGESQLKEADRFVCRQLPAFL